MAEAGVKARLLRTIRMSETSARDTLLAAWQRITSRNRTNGNGAPADAQPRGARAIPQRLRRLWTDVWHATPVGDADAYRRLALQLHHTLARGEARRSVLVTTAAHSDASARMSTRLARSIAEELGRPVLLVDASEQMELTHQLGAEPPQGLSDLIACPDMRLQDLTLATSHELVSFLPRGNRHHAQGWAAHNVTRTMADIATYFDFAVISAGGLLANGLALGLASQVGQVLLLATEGLTHRSEINAVRSTLLMCRVDNITIVLTERSSSAEP